MSETLFILTIIFDLIVSSRCKTNLAIMLAKGEAMEVARIFLLSLFSLDYSINIMNKKS